MLRIDRPGEAGLVVCSHARRLGGKLGSRPAVDTKRVEEPRPCVGQDGHAGRLLDDRRQQMSVPVGVGEIRSRRGDGVSQDAPHPILGTGEVGNRRAHRVAEARGHGQHLPECGPWRLPATCRRRRRAATRSEFGRHLGSVLRQWQCRSGSTSRSWSPTGCSSRPPRRSRSTPRRRCHRRRSRRWPAPGRSLRPVAQTRRSRRRSPRGSAAVAQPAATRCRRAAPRSRESRVPSEADRVGHGASPFRIRLTVPGEMPTSTDPRPR